jgi:hypothetical protein
LLAVDKVIIANAFRYTLQVMKQKAKQINGLASSSRKPGSYGTTESCAAAARIRSLGKRFGFLILKDASERSR